MDNCKEVFDFSYQVIEDGHAIDDVTFSIDVDGGIEIHRLHRQIKCFVRACGYAAEAVEEVFGADTYSEWE